MKNQTPMPTSKDQPRKPTIAELEQGLEAYHTKLRIFLQHEGFGALREHWIDTYFAMKYAEELAKARDEEFARRVHVPHLPPAEHCRCLEVCLRRNSGLRIAYRPAVFLGDWWNRSSGLDQEWFFSRNAWLKFEDVVAFEQGRPTDLVAAELLNPEADTFAFARLRLGEIYGGFCWEIENSKLVPAVLQEQEPAARRRLAGKLRHWVVRIDPYKFEIVGTSLEFPLTPVKQLKPRKAPRA